MIREKIEKCRELSIKLFCERKVILHFYIFVSLAFLPLTYLLLLCQISRWLSFAISKSRYFKYSAIQTFLADPLKIGDSRLTVVRAQRKKDVVNNTCEANGS